MALTIGGNMLRVMKSVLVVCLMIMGAQIASADYIRPEEPYRPGRPNRPERPPRPEHPNRLQYDTIGHAKTNKFVDEVFIFRPHRWDWRVYSARIVGTKTRSDIKSVEVMLIDGRVIPLHQLTGTIQENRAREAYIGGYQISEIRVVATSANLTGSRGEFRVDLGFRRH